MNIPFESDAVAEEYGVIRVGDATFKSSIMKIWI